MTIKNIFQNIINFFKKRGLVLLSCIFFILSAALIILFINLLSDYKALKNKMLNRETELSNLISEQESYISDIKNLQEEIYELQKSEADQLTATEELAAQLKENQMLQERSELIEQSKKITYKDEDLFEKIVYLTFDDGPSARTESILKILDEYNIKATFFVNYNIYSDENELYKKITDKGHTIGNHTYSHTLPASNWTEFYLDFFKMEDYIYEKTGVRTNIVRFPGGSKYEWIYLEENKERAIEFENMGYIFFDWNVSNYDSSSDIVFNDSDEMANYVISQSRGRNIIILLLHDRSKKYMTVASLDKIIEFYRDEGYVFLPLSESSVNMRFFNRDN